MHFQNQYDNKPSPSNDQDIFRSNELLKSKRESRHKLNSDIDNIDAAILQKSMHRRLTEENLRFLVEDEDRQSPLKKMEKKISRASLNVSNDIIDVAIQTRRKSQETPNGTKVFDFLQQNEEEKNRFSFHREDNAPPKTNDSLLNLQVQEEES